METNKSTGMRQLLGRWISVAIMLAAVVLGLAVLYHANYYPRTEDAEIFANFIGIAPQVDGPIIRVNVKDNQFVKKGELLYEIDDRPYQYALENAQSEQAALEGQISDEQRKIAALVSAVSVAQANIHSREANVTNAERGVSRARAEWNYANNNLHRLEPLLTKQFVTVDQVDQARTAVTARQQAVDQARSQVALAEAQVLAAKAQYEQAKAAMQQSHAQLAQSQHSVLTLEPLTAQREGKAAAIRTAEYNFNNCRVYAPFDARVTNLTISQGAYAHTGQQVFTLIDTRVWWAVANFRETQLRHIKPGMHADVYVLSRPNVRYDGVVDSVGFGVQPDATLVGSFAPGLPDVQRSLNWVHLATRYPVRVRILAPETEPFRLSESAVVVMRAGGRTQ